MDLNTLSRNNPHPRDAYISFEEETHYYTISIPGRETQNGYEYTSVTQWIHRLFQPFNADKIIDKMMSAKSWPKSKYFGMTKKEIKAKWEENRDDAATKGTAMHYDIECFYNKNSVHNESDEYRYFNDFEKTRMESHVTTIPYRTEWMIFDEDLLLAGSVDMIYEEDSGVLKIFDWKRSREIKKTNQWQSALPAEISHIPDSNYWHYALQLNMYKTILERKYDKQINELALICLHPDNHSKTYIKYNVPFLTSEMEALLLLRKKELK